MFTYHFIRWLLFSRCSTPLIHLPYTRTLVATIVIMAKQTLFSIHVYKNASFIPIQWSQSCELKFSINWFLFQLINVEMIAVSLRHLGVQFLYGSLRIWELECWDPERIRLVTAKWKYVLMVGCDIDPPTPAFYIRNRSGGSWCFWSKTR